MVGDIEQSVMDQAYYFTDIQDVDLNEISHSGWKGMCAYDLFQTKSEKFKIKLKLDDDCRKQYGYYRVKFRKLIASRLIVYDSRFFFQSEYLKATTIDFSLYISMT